jgi:hypothetical protein
MIYQPYNHRPNVVKRNPSQSRRLSARGPVESRLSLGYNAVAVTPDDIRFCSGFTDCNFSPKHL